MLSREQCLLLWKKLLPLLSLLSDRCIKLDDSTSGKIQFGLRFTRIPCPHWNTETSKQRTNRKKKNQPSLGYMFTVNSGLVNLGPLRTPLLAQVKMSSCYDERVWLLYFQSEWLPVRCLVIQKGVMLKMHACEVLCIWRYGGLYYSIGKSISYWCVFVIWILIFLSAHGPILSAHVNYALTDLLYGIMKLYGVYGVNNLNSNPHT